MSKSLPNLEKTLWLHKAGAYAESCLKIEDKASGRISPFILNAHQRKVQDAIDAQRRAAKPVRIIILKPRQTGISTVSSANVFHGCRFHAGTSMVVSKDLDSSEHIFGIIQRFHYYLPEREKMLLKPLASNRKELKLEEPHGGRILVETAGKSSAGHSFTIRNLLLSEVSRWPEGCEDTIVGLLNAVPYGPDTAIIIESVANGVSGWFWREWHKQASDYVKVFLPWFEHSEYQRELPMPADKYQATLEDTERSLMARHNLSLEQLEWRRWAIRNNCQDDPEKFKEQYPATEQEAFIASGNTFFHVPTLESIEASDPLRCNLEVFQDISARDEIRLVPQPRGYLRLWRKPQPNHQYVIGADVAEGIEIEDAPADDKHDYSSADVLDRNTGEQVAQLHGKLTPDEFGRQLSLLGEYYNYAFVGVESNAGYGQHVINTLQEENYPAHLIYRQQVLDETTRKMTNKLGWRTTKANRRSLMSQLDMALRKKEVFVNSEETLMELRAFTVKPDGRIEAGAGHKDDRVFSLAIAYEMFSAAVRNISFNIGEQAEPEKLIAYAPLRSVYRYRRLNAATTIN